MEAKHGQGLVDAIRDKPIWKLTDAEIDRLDEQEQNWVISHRAFLRDTGTLAVLLANPEDTAYETVFDSKLGWKLQPVIANASS